MNHHSNFDNAVQRIRLWVSDRPGTSGLAGGLTPSASSSQLATLSLAMSAAVAPGLHADGASSTKVQLSSSQRKKLKSYLKRCRLNPRHSQLSLEAYLLLPVQRIPRYRLLVS